MVPPYAIGAGAPIMSKPPAEQITEVGSESAGDPEKAAVKNKGADEDSLPNVFRSPRVKKLKRRKSRSRTDNRLRSQGAIPTAAKGSWSRVSIFFLPSPRCQSLTY